MFFVNGVVIASWVPHVPTIKARHGLSDGTLGLVLLCLAGGAVLALPLAGRLVGRLGSRTTTVVAALGLCLALPLPALSPTVILLAMSLGLLGAFNGLLDVSMNAQAILVETAHGRPIMSSFHGLYSLGGLGGSVAAGTLIAAGLSAAQHTGLVAGASLLAVVAGLPGLVPSVARSGISAPVFARPGRALLGLGGLAFAGLLVEGAMVDWSAVFLRDSLGTTSGLAAAGFAAFSLAMAAGRFGGDRLVSRVGPRATVRACSVVAAVGLTVALLVGRPSVAVVGFGLVGFGIANIIPVLFSAAAKVDGVAPGAAIAAVATTGYVGFLAGPPVIGLVAEVATLPAALGIVAVLCALVALFSGVLDRAEGRGHHDRAPERIQTAAGRVQFAVIEGGGEARDESRRYSTGGELS